MEENPTVDRSAAQRGQPNESLLNITLQIDGQLRSYAYSNTVDWENREDIRAVNRWRQQVFR